MGSYHRLRAEPQLMIYHESHNPVYGRTNNPWDLDRTPGGTTGGEEAIITAGDSSLGLGSGIISVKVMAALEDHFCAQPDYPKSNLVSLIR